MSPGKCVLLSTSKSVRKATKLWDISGDGRFWKVQLDGRDLCGQLDFTRSARAGTLLNGLGRLQLVLLLLVLCLLGFRSSLAWLEVSIFLLVFMLLKLLLSPPLRLVPSGLLSCGLFGPVRCPLASTPAILNLLGWPVGVDPAFHIVWVGIWLIALREEPRIFWMLDLISGGPRVAVLSIFCLSLSLR